ncbi:MAG: UPF0149 family protein [Steroidobacteraceae bacterium]
MTYAALQSALDRMTLGIGAAEAHGWLCGALCVREPYGPSAWQADLAQGTAIAGARKAAVLAAVHRDTLEALRAPDFAFVPLLPGDDAPLSERIEALASWCSGFLYGMATGPSGEAVMRRGEIGEFVRDLTEISRADARQGAAGASGESDFTELQEFVRAGAQLAWEELADLRADSPRPGAAAH